MTCSPRRNYTIVKSLGATGCHSERHAESSLSKSLDPSLTLKMPSFPGFPPGFQPSLSSGPNPLVRWIIA